MNAFEIVATVILCMIGSSTVLFGFYSTLLIEKFLERLETEKRPASKNEADEEK